MPSKQLTFNFQRLSIALSRGLEMPRLYLRPQRGWPSTAQSKQQEENPVLSQQRFTLKLRRSHRVVRSWAPSSATVSWIFQSFFFFSK